MRTVAWRVRSVELRMTDGTVQFRGARSVHTCLTLRPYGDLYIIVFVRRNHSSLCECGVATHGSGPYGAMVSEEIRINKEGLS